jgi:hypothetical protein
MQNLIGVPMVAVSGCGSIYTPRDAGEGVPGTSFHANTHRLSSLEAVEKRPNEELAKKLGEGIAHKAIPKLLLRINKFGSAEAATLVG